MIPESSDRFAPIAAEVERLLGENEALKKELARVGFLIVNGFVTESSTKELYISRSPLSNETECIWSRKTHDRRKGRNLHRRDGALSTLSSGKA